MTQFLDDPDDLEIARRLRRAAGVTPDVYVAYDEVLGRVSLVRRRRRLAVTGTAGFALLLAAGSYVLHQQTTERSLVSASASTDPSVPSTPAVATSTLPALTTTTTLVTTTTVVVTVAPTSPPETEAPTTVVTTVVPVTTVTVVTTPAAPPPTAKPKPKPKPPAAPPATAAPTTEATTAPAVPETTAPPTAPPATDPPPTTTSLPVSTTPPPGFPESTELPVPQPTTLTGYANLSGNQLWMVWQDGKLAVAQAQPVAQDWTFTSSAAGNRRVTGSFTAPDGTRVNWVSALDGDHITISAV